jgi:threonine dehydrogenase-like Zn-dependent dehydrogenase
VRGLVFDLSIPKYALARAVGGRFPRVHYGRGSCLSLRELPSPALPGKGWLRLRPLLTGLCGSDLATVFFKASPQLEPFSSFPAVLGHEILAEITEVPDGVHGLTVGQRVAVNPVLPCRLLGITPQCAPCAQGHENGCEKTAAGCLAPGMLIGFHRELPGGMGTEMVAHESQLFPLPDGLSDEAGVLIEPLSVSLHAVLKRPPRPTDKVLIIGGGPVAFATLWALRALGHTCQVTLLTVEAYQLALAKSLGADDVLRAAPDREEAQAVAERTGATVYRPTLGPPALSGGFEHTYDCVGSAASLQDALRYTRTFGTVVLIGAAGHVRSLDWTTVWKNELTVMGSYVYGLEDFRGKKRHTFDITRELLAQRAGPDPSALVTHHFPLSQYARAIEANLDRGRHRSIKTVFDLRETP